MIYIDTSLVVSLHVTEVRSYSAVSWFERRAGDVFLISDWTDVEVASALSRKVRSGKITEEQRQRATDAYAVMRDGLFQRLTIAPGNYQRAVEMLREPSTGLRAGDALHLAIAEAHGASVASLDATLMNAANHFGLAVELIA